MEAAREFFAMSEMLIATDKEGFQGMLDEWRPKWRRFMEGRTGSSAMGKSTHAVEATERVPQPQEEHAVAVDFLRPPRTALTIRPESGFFS